MATQGCGATISVRARDNQGERRCRGATIMPSRSSVGKICESVTLKCVGDWRGAA